MRGTFLFNATLEELRAFEMPAVEGRPFGQIVIVPMNELHDSEWRCMKFILLDHDSNPVAVVGGFSDVVHLNGIGGYGPEFDIALKTNMVERIDWSIDCLPGSGCLRLFVSKDIYLSIGGYVLSDFSVMAERRHL